LTLKKKKSVTQEVRSKYQEKVLWSVMFLVKLRLSHSP